MFLNELEQSLLKQRGVTTEDEIEAFLHPSYEKDLYDPFLLPDMERACERIESAIATKQRILIYADYDADGVPAGVLMVRFFEAIGITVDIYIPERNRDGFGINMTAAQQFVGRYDLIVSVDCGSVDHEPIEYLTARGVDVIVTDHHQVADTLPHAYAVVNPQRHDSKYPFTTICGATVAWKVVQALLMRQPNNLPVGWEKWLLGMAAIGTVCDMMPLIDENRTIVTYGLIALKKLSWPGWKELCRRAGIEQSHITAKDIAFSIGPRINAASRLGSVDIVRELFLTSQQSVARENAQELELLNTSRKQLVKEMIRQAHTKVSTDDTVLVIGDNAWKPSLAGLVASSLAETYQKPVFVWGLAEDGSIKGSCRSGDHYSVVDMMNRCPEDLFTHHGGHTHAGGFALKKESLSELSPALQESVLHAERLVVEQQESFVSARISDFTQSLLTFLSGCEPFGIGNEEPLFEVRGIVSQITPFGKEKEYTKGRIEDDTGSISLINFSSTPLKGGKSAYLCRFEKNTFNSFSELRLVVVREIGKTKRS